MRELKDIFGKELNAGDVILYSVKHSTYVDTHMAVIDRVIDDPESYDRYSLKVRAYAPHKWTWNTEKQKSEWIPVVYRTTLYSNRTIVKLNNMTIPEDFVKLLTATIV